MTRNDLIGLIGLILFIAGIGGGVEMTLLAQNQAYNELLAAGGAVDVMAFGQKIQRATRFIELGIPVGMVGMVLMAIAVRGYCCCCRQCAGEKLP